ncbi:MAG: carboxymuconolactone decarboxylase family protein [Cycloclasticus sp.]
MQSRLNLQTIEPAAYHAMLGMESYLESCDLDSTLKELIKISASQLNGCAYCIQMHADVARKQGETEHRIDALAAWQESPLFSEQERAVLALTEEVTNISNGAVTDKTYRNCKRHLNDHLIAQCIMFIVQINSWNRIALATKMVF